MENMEMNNVAAEVMENVAEAAVINWKRAGLIGGTVILGGTLVVVGIKKGIPWAKEQHENRKAKKLEKKLKAAAEIDAVEK